MMQLYNCRPADAAGRLEREMAVYDFLDGLQISYQRVDHEAAYTMEACRAVDRVLAPAVICKNLLLCNRQKTQFYLLMLREDKQFRTAELSKQIGSSRLSFAPPEEMERLLKCNPGSLSVLGLMNDTTHAVRLLVDSDLLASEMFGCHPCINTSSLRLHMCDLIERFLPAVGHTAYPVVLRGKEEPKEQKEQE